MSRTISVVQFWMDEHYQWKLLMWIMAISLTLGGGLLLWKRPQHQALPDSRVNGEALEQIRSPQRSAAESTLMVMKVRKVSMVATPQAKGF